MNKEELIELIEKLELPKDEYYILSSGCLALYDLRDKVGDLDLCISNECGFYKLNELVEFVVNDKKNFVRDFRMGYPVEKLEKVLEFKKRMNRPKDLKDINSIKKFLDEETEKRDLYNKNKK